MKLTENQERERIARRIRLTFISLLFLPALAVSRSVNLSAKTGDFDGARAYEHVRHLVDIGPRPPASDGIHRAQAYIIGQLKNFGCQVEEHDFRGSTPLGDVAMKNIIAKIAGTSTDIVLYST